MFSMIKGLGVGAGLMYLFDPERGEKRRAQVQDDLKKSGGQVNAWMTEALHDPVAHAPALVAAAAGSLIGLRMLARRPVTTLALGALGLAFAAPRLKAGMGQGGWLGMFDPQGGEGFDADRLGRYSATSRGYGMRAGQADPSPDPAFPDWPATPTPAALVDPGPTG